MEQEEHKAKRAWLSSLVKLAFWWVVMTWLPVMLMVKGGPSTHPSVIIGLISAVFLLLFVRNLRIHKTETKRQKIIQRTIAYPIMLLQAYICMAVLYASIRYLLEK